MKNEAAMADRLFKSQEQPAEPEPTVGPVKVDIIQGKGRGLVAASDIQPGTILYVSEPIMTVRPEADALQLAQSCVLLPMKQSTRELLDQLYDGSSASTTGLPNLHHICHRACDEPCNDGYVVDALRACLGSSNGQCQQHDEELLSAAIAFLNNGGAVDDELEPSNLVGEAATLVAQAMEEHHAQLQQQQERITRIAKLNALRISADAVAATVRGEEPGLPHIYVLSGEVAMTNHSCAPNSEAIMIGSRVLGIAVAPILRGQEVTMCYDGLGSQTPLPTRTQRLNNWGFQCSCTRCHWEGNLPQQQQQILQSAHQFIDKISPLGTSAHEALSSLSTSQCRKLLSQALKHQAKVASLADSLLSQPQHQALHRGTSDTNSLSDTSPVSDTSPSKQVPLNMSSTIASPGKDSSNHQHADHATTSTTTSTTPPAKPVPSSPALVPTPQQQYAWAWGAVSQLPGLLAALTQRLQGGALGTSDLELLFDDVEKLWALRPACLPGLRSAAQLYRLCIKVGSPEQRQRAQALLMRAVAVRYAAEEGGPAAKRLFAAAAKALK